MRTLAVNVEQITGFTYLTDCFAINNNYSSSDTENPATEFPPSVAELASTPSPELCPSDSHSDLSDLGSPVLKQPRIEREPEASAANIDVADVVKRRGSLSESEKYDFYCNHYTPDDDFKFPPVKSCSFRLRYLRKYKWLIYS